MPVHSILKIKSLVSAHLNNEFQPKMFRSYYSVNLIPFVSENNRYNVEYITVVHPHNNPSMNQGIGLFLVRESVDVYACATVVRFAHVYIQRLELT